MYFWLDEMPRRSRKEERRPPGSAGREFLRLAPGPLRELIATEIERIGDRDSARLSRAATTLSLAIILASTVSMVLTGGPLDVALLAFGPPIAIFAVLWSLLQWILVHDARKLAPLLAVLPEIRDPSYAGALLPLLNYHPTDWHKPLKPWPNPLVEKYLLELLPRLEPRHVEQWEPRDWSNFRILLRTRHGSARLVTAALDAAARMGSGEILSALRPLALNVDYVYHILDVRDPDAQHICDAARLAILRIEANLTNVRQAATLLRASHVRETSRDDELVRPVPLHDATPREQLLRTAKSGTNPESDLLRVSNIELRD